VDTGIFGQKVVINDKLLRPEKDFPSGVAWGIIRKKQRNHFIFKLLHTFNAALEQFLLLYIEPFGRVVCVQCYSTSWERAKRTTGSGQIQRLRARLLVAYAPDLPANIQVAMFFGLRGYPTALENFKLKRSGILLRGARIGVY
jgi:hypothetical protein